MRGLLRVLAAGMAVLALLGAALPSEAWVAGRRSRGMGRGRGFSAYPLYLPYWSPRDLWCFEQRYLDRRARERGDHQQDPERVRRVAEECGPQQSTPGR